MPYPDEYADVAKVMDTLAEINDAGERWLASRPPLKAPLKARLDGEAFQLRIIPFGGPVGGLDVDMERFSPQTNIYPEWFEKRPVLWHHGKDPLMKGTLLGYSTDLHMEEDGWWETVWLKAGERRAEMVRRLSEKAPIYGSSGALHPHMVRREGQVITAWPHAETTLSTSPQNTFAVTRPMKAVLDDFDLADIALLPALKAALGALDELRELPIDPAHGLGGEAVKAGRELSTSNLSEIEEWVAVLNDIASRAASLSNRVRTKYQPKEET